MTEARVRSPEFITFTGADDFTDVQTMIDLAAQYPIEWGILFSPSRQGTGRYPGGDAQSRFCWSGLRLSAHLCGRHSANVMEGRDVETPVDLGVFKRVQVNHVAPLPSRVLDFARGWGVRGIAQWRRPTFCNDTSVDWLFDASGGRGIEPSEWPAYPGRLVGYAGGISPRNVVDVLTKIDATGPYWIDMESGVRANDRFDLSLCRAVCESVFSAVGVRGTEE